MGYSNIFGPWHDGPGVSPDWELLGRHRRRHMEIQVDIQARKFFGEFLNGILTHMRDIWTWRLGSTQNFDTKLPSIEEQSGESFWKNHQI